VVADLDDAVVGRDVYEIICAAKYAPVPRRQEAHIVFVEGGSSFIRLGLCGTVADLDSLCSQTPRPRLVPLQDELDESAIIVTPLKLGAQSALVLAISYIQH